MVARCVGGWSVESARGVAAMLGSPNCVGTAMASWAASANSTVVAYRWSGSLAMPRAITLSSCGGTFGWLVDGCGGGVLRCAATRLPMLAPTKGGCPVRHSYNTQVNA